MADYAALICPVRSKEWRAVIENSINRLPTGDFTRRTSLLHIHNCTGLRMQHNNTGLDNVVVKRNRDLLLIGGILRVHCDNPTDNGYHRGGTVIRAGHI